MGFKKGSKDYLILNAYNAFVYETLVTFEEKQLKKNNFAYKMLIKEFHDGILIYDLMKTEIWDKANVDTVGLKRFYNDHKAEYIKDDYIKASIFRSQNPS